MNSKFEQQITKAGQDRKQEPSQVAWQRIQDKLSTKKQENKRISIGTWSIAANLVVVLSSLFLITLYLKQKNPGIFLTKADSKPIKMEELSISSEDGGIYAKETLSMLKSAYKNSASKPF